MDRWKGKQKNEEEKKERDEQQHENHRGVSAAEGCKGALHAVTCYMVDS